LRAGAVYSLLWGAVDTERGILTLRDTKSGKSRHNFLTEELKEIFTERTRGAYNALVFPTYTRAHKNEVSKRPMRFSVTVVFK